MNTAVDAQDIMGRRADAPLALVRDAIQRNALKSSEHGPIISPSGQPQDWMIDLRPVFLEPDTLVGIAGLFWQRFANKLPFQLAAMETAAIPLLTALLLSARQRGLEVSGVIIRKERKQTGRGNSIEGRLADLPIVLVDDILNSGDSAEKARVVLEQAGHNAREMFAVIDFESDDGRAWRTKCGIEVSSLFSLSDFGLHLGRKRRSHSQQYRNCWRFATPGANPYHVVPKSAPLLVDDRLIVGTDSGKMCAIDANTGKESWCFEAKGAFKPKGIWSSPCHANGKIYFGAYNGDVYCLDAKSGSEVWSNPCCEWVGSSPLLVTEHDLVFIGLEYEKQNKKGSIAALSARTGQKKWEHWLDQYQHGSGVYWRKGDLVIFGTNDHTVVALSAPTGKLAWQFKTGRSVKHAPAIDGETGIVAFASFDKSIYILDVATGEKKAEIPTQNICYTTPLIHDGLLFCGSGDRHLYVVSLATMSLIKKIEVGARVYSSPRVVAGRVIFGTSGGRVIEVDPQSLEIVGVTVVPDAVTNAIAVAADGSRIFVPTYMNEIYCVERLP